MAKKWTTTADFIQYGKVGGITTNSTIETEGFNAIGDGGGDTWKHNGVTGQTPSQSPAQLGDALFNDSNGDQWSLVPLAAASKLEINAKTLGLKADNVSDDTLPLKAAILSLVETQPQGGGVVMLPRGVIRTSEPVDVYSDIKLAGQGKTLTYIKPLDSATFGTNQAVIQSVDFNTVEGTNLWDYYAPYPHGLVMGFEIDGVCIDGNRDNVANAGGLYIYGGKWQIGDIAVISTDGHGIWTEAGVPGTSTAGDDLHDYLNMHESYGENIYICNANKHGWLYRGPNDSSITDIQVKTCGWGGFYQESTGNNSVGNLEIQSLHAYSCGCNHDSNGAMVTLANANVQFLYVDASKKRGLLTENSVSIIDQLLILGNDSANAGFDAITLDVTTQITMIRNSEKDRTSGTAGKFLVVNQPSIIGQLRTFKGGASTIPQKIIEANAQLDLKSAVIGGYSVAGSVALDVSAQRCDVFLSASNCDTAVEYNTSGRNKLTLNALSCVTDINNISNFATSDIVTRLSDNLNLSEKTAGRAILKAISVTPQDVGYSAEITPTPRSYSSIKVGTLTSGITINTPTSPSDGDILRLQFQQDGTGGHAISFSTDYKSSYNNTGNTAFTRASIEFYYDGTFWVQNYFSGWF